MYTQHTITGENLNDWQEKKYAEFYAEEYDFLKRRLAQGVVDVNDLEGVLQSLYIFDDNNLDGRSVVMQLSLSASIAAYEAVIAELKSVAQKN